MRWTWFASSLSASCCCSWWLAVGVWLLIQSIDRGAVMARAVQEVKSATGRDFAIDGKMRFRVFPHLALVAEGVRLGNASWGSRPDMARIRAASSSRWRRPCCHGAWKSAGAQIRGVDLLLETNADQARATGTSNAKR